LEQKIGIPFREPDGGAEVGIFGTGSLIFVPPRDFFADFLAFFSGVGVVEAFRLPTRVLNASALDPVTFKTRDRGDEVVQSLHSVNKI
jgi:hypothetical protein